MAQTDKTGKHTALETAQIRASNASAMVKRTARSELRRILAEELKERQSEQLLSRSATASQSQ